MKLRQLEILKKEALLYKYMKEEINGKNVVVHNPKLEIPLTKLWKRKNLIETLNKDGLEENEKKKLYLELEENNAYFEDLTKEEREDINKLFVSADDSYARSAEWQNFHMAFLFTAGLSSYKAVDNFQANFANLKERKSVIDKALEEEENSKAMANKADPATTVENAASQLEKYTKELDELKKKHTQEISEPKKILENLSKDYREYKSSKAKYDDEKKRLNDFANLEKDMKKDSESLKFMSSEELDELIKNQKEILQKNEEEKAEALKNISPEFNNYLNATYTEEEKEKLDFLNNFKKDLKLVVNCKREVQEEAFGEYYGEYADTTFYGLENALADGIGRSKGDVGKVNDFWKKLTGKMKVFAEMYHTINPELADDEYNGIVRSLLLKKIEGIADELINEMSKNLNARKTEMFNNLSENEKNFFSPFEESEKKAKNLIDKLEGIKANNDKRTEATYNREYNRFINRKIREGNYQLEQISNQDLGKVNGNDWLKEKKELCEEKIANFEQTMKATKENYEKYLKEDQKLTSINEKFAKEKKEYTSKINHASKMKEPDKHFNFNAYEKAIAEQCQNVPKLDFTNVMEEKQRAGQALLEMAEKYADGHKNSTEFNKMVKAMTCVTNWGTKDADREKEKDTPKTYEDAVKQLKESVKEYVEAKKKQKRLFPSKLRRLRFEIAKAFNAYADIQKVNMKDVDISKEVADSWDKYFETKGQTEILEEKEKAVETGNKQMEEKQSKETTETKEIEPEELDSLRR